MRGSVVFVGLLAFDMGDTTAAAAGSCGSLRHPPAPATLRLVATSPNNMSGWYGDIQRTHRASPVQDRLGTKMVQCSMT